MSLSSTFYKATKNLGDGIAAAFNWASGNTALRERGLKREEFDAAFSMAYGGVGLLVASGLSIVILNVSPVIALSLGVAAAFIPTRLQAAYIVGKDDAEKAKDSNKKPSGGCSL